MIVKTLKVRIRDKHRAILNKMASECNYIWNAVNEETFDFAHTPIPEVGIMYIHRTAFEMSKQMAALRKEKGFIIHSHTVQEVTETHEKARKQFKKSKLRWRCSSGSRRSLGWVPFKRGSAKWINGQIRYAGFYFNVWDSYGLNKYDLRNGSFSQDTRGRWYFNVVVEIKSIKNELGVGEIGIDFGLKTTATCSDGTILKRQNIYRNAEEKLKKAQRAKKKKRVKTIHAKIKNKRKDILHKFSNKIVKENSLIVVGNISSASLAKTKMSKSVLDAGWGMLKTMIDYKSKAMQSAYIEVNEAYSTQTCSCCGVIPANSPKGRAGLGIREWTCPDCGTTHDRDINAAKNILRLGHQALAVGIESL